MKKILISVIGAALILSLVGCGAEAQPKEEEKVDTVSTASVYTNKYTNMDQKTLVSEIARYSGVTVVATSNADGTPNIAVLTPGVVGEEYVIFNTAPNTTQENIRRDKIAEMVFDKVNLAAETKEGRHQGATVKLELVEDQAIIDELKKQSDRIVDISMVCKIVEVMPIG